MNAKHQQKKPRIKATLKYLVVLVLVLLLVVLQDLLRPKDQDFSSFYSEPFLRNAFWILIFPITILLNLIFRKASTITRIRVLLVKRLLFAVIASVLHIFIFAMLLNLVSAYFYEHTFAFKRNLGFAISRDLYKYLLIYSVLALVLVRKPRNVKSN